MSPPNITATSLLAEILDSTGEPARALNVYLDAEDMGLSPAPQVQIHKADLYRQMGHYRDAEPLYRSLVANGSAERANARLHLAEMLSWMHRNDEAFPLFDEVLREDPSNREARLARARALNAAGRREEAISEYRALTTP